MEQELEAQIEAYLDGRMDGPSRERFERRMETDPAIRENVHSATRSLELIQKALGWATPDGEFDTKVTSKIREISGAAMPIVDPSERQLTKDDPEARLLTDPAAEREQARLKWMAIVTGIVFAIALGVIVYFLKRIK